MACELSSSQGLDLSREASFPRGPTDCRTREDRQVFSSPSDGPLQGFLGRPLRSRTSSSCGFRVNVVFGSIKEVRVRLRRFLADREREVRVFTHRGARGQEQGIIRQMPHLHRGPGEPLEPSFEALTISLPNPGEVGRILKVSSTP